MIMKIDKKPLTIVVIVGVAIGLIFGLVNTYLAVTAPSREVDKVLEEMDKLERNLNKATEKRKREEAGRY